MRTLATALGLLSCLAAGDWIDEGTGGERIVLALEEGADPLEIALEVAQEEGLLLTAKSGRKIPGHEDWIGGHLWHQLVKRVFGKGDEERAIGIWADLIIECVLVGEECGAWGSWWFWAPEASASWPGEAGLRRLEQAARTAPDGELHDNYLVWAARRHLEAGRLDEALRLWEEIGTSWACVGLLRCNQFVDEAATLRGELTLQLARSLAAFGDVEGALGLADRFREIEPRPWWGPSPERDRHDHFVEVFRTEVLCATGQCEEALRRVLELDGRARELAAATLTVEAAKGGHTGVSLSAASVVVLPAARITATANAARALLEQGLVSDALLMLESERWVFPELSSEGAIAALDELLLDALERDETEVAYEAARLRGLRWSSSAPGSWTRLAGWYAVQGRPDMLLAAARRACPTGDSCVDNGAGFWGGLLEDAGLDCQASALEWETMYLAKGASTWIDLSCEPPGSQSNRPCPIGVLGDSAPDGYLTMRALSAEAARRGVNLNEVIGGRSFDCLDEWGLYLAAMADGRYSEATEFWGRGGPPFVDAIAAWATAGSPLEAFEFLEPTFEGIYIYGERTRVARVLGRAGLEAECLLLLARDREIVEAEYDNKYPDLEISADHIWDWTVSEYLCGDPQAMLAQLAEAADPVWVVEFLVLMHDSAQSATLGVA